MMTSMILSSLQFMSTAVIDVLGTMTCLTCISLNPMMLAIMVFSCSSIYPASALTFKTVSRSFAVIMGTDEDACPPKRVIKKLLILRNTSVMGLIILYILTIGPISIRPSFSVLCMANIFGEISPNIIMITVMTAATATATTGSFMLKNFAILSDRNAPIVDAAIATVFMHIKSVARSLFGSDTHTFRYFDLGWLFFMFAAIFILLIPVMDVSAREKRAARKKRKNSEINCSCVIKSIYFFSSAFFRYFFSFASILTLSELFMWSYPVTCKTPCMRSEE